MLLVKYKGCHHKEAMWMKHVHLDHLPKLVNKFEQDMNLEWRGLGRKNKDPSVNGLNVDEDINL
jgi:hypothetical protein